VKIVACAISIGSGGSGGREGLTAQISAGFRSMLGRWPYLTPLTRGSSRPDRVGERRDPPGTARPRDPRRRGSVRGGRRGRRLIPSLIASIVEFAVFGAVEGFTPIFGRPGNWLLLFRRPSISGGWTGLSNLT
jgi:chloride channel protein, CIC family